MSCRACDDPIKPQGIRLLDVWVIGPLMIYAATLLPVEREYTRAALKSFGFGTVIYNARNYLLIRQQQLTQNAPVEDTGAPGLR